MVQISPESRCKYWATRLSILSFVRFVCSLSHIAHSQARGKVYNLMSQYHLVLNYSALVVKINDQYSLFQTLTTNNQMTFHIDSFLNETYFFRGKKN